MQGKSARSHTKYDEPVVLGNRPEIMPGSETTYQSYGISWVNMSNTPFRLYKHWMHKGGISTQLIAHWPQRIADKGALRHTQGQLTDMMPTLLEVTGAAYPGEYKGDNLWSGEA